MIDPPQITRTNHRPAALLQVTVPREEIRTVMGPGYTELMAVVRGQGVVPAGPWFTHHLRMDPAVFDFEIGIPISSPIAPSGRVKLGEWPAQTVARTIYHGPYEGLGSAWAEFDRWILTSGHSPGPDLYESYLTGPESNPDPATYRTELTRPLRP